MFKLIVLLAVVLVAVNAAEYGQQSYEHKGATSYQNYNLKNSEHVEYVKVPVVEKKEYHHQPQQHYAPVQHASSGHY